MTERSNIIIAVVGHDAEITPLTKLLNGSPGVTAIAYDRVGHYEEAALTTKFDAMVVPWPKVGAEEDAFFGAYSYDSMKAGKPREMLILVPKKGAKAPDPELMGRIGRKRFINGDADTVVRHLSANIAA